MHPRLLVSADPSWIEATIKRLSLLYAVPVSGIFRLTPETTIGIEMVRGIKHNLARKSYDGENRLVVLLHADRATLEAQNALLKLLEEPPTDTLLLLVTDNENSLLPTVCSRCLITRVVHENKAVSLSGTEIVSFFQQILAAGAGRRLCLIQDGIKTKEDAIRMIRTFIVVLHHELHAPHPQLALSSLEIATMLKRCEQAGQAVEGNVHSKAVVDVLILGFPFRL